LLSENIATIENTRNIKDTQYYIFNAFSFTCQVETYIKDAFQGKLS